VSAKRLSIRQVTCVVMLLTLSVARAQIGIAIRADVTKYLCYEPIEITVIMRNYSGNTLVFNGRDASDRGYLKFEVDTPSEVTVGRLDSKANPVENMILGAGDTQTLKLVLNELFSMQGAGRYRIKAKVGHHRLQSDYESNVVTVDVRKGIPMITRTIGLPAKDHVGPIRSVEAVLLLLNDTAGSMYCLRVEDDKQVYGTVRVAPYISGTKPQMDADANSDIHILIQSRPRLYSYSVYTLANLVLRLRQERYYVGEPTAPRLTREPGFLKAVGGRLAVEGVDYRLSSPSATK